MESSQSVRSDREETLIRQISCLDLKIKQIKKIANLAPAVRAKIEALKRTQQELLEREAEFHRKVHSLEVEQQKVYDEVNDKRRLIVTGSGVPPMEGVPECNDDAADQSSGIPEFWLTVFKMTPVLQTMIREADEEALKRLVDVRVVLKNDPQPGFVLLFEFEPNEFFNDRVLKKEYMMKCVPDADKPFAFNGFEIYDTIGQDIDWKEGANLTKLRVRDESGLAHEVVTTSFFNFFNPKDLFEENSLVSVQFLETDFEIGYYIKERVIPRATSFFVGEIDDTDLDDFSDSPESESVSGTFDLEAEPAATEL
ncbi:nucleosome assembly protein 1-like 1 [Toxorhynchites rutilus septentrionalis]|uniref:nucleosome assembly protein 1-like 1 n=1 Tax=Toxorhynchites rutilus septentrionalis TaxID=329112 RepID=UPI002479A1F2|nr:nucleosome assembly protein 1-like 1 [Toxorhynchites rutilus septentrionalis]